MLSMPAAASVSRLLKRNSGPSDILLKPSWITIPFNCRVSSDDPEQQ
jgi:hypothetical protein